MGGTGLTEDILRNLSVVCVLVHCKTENDGLVQSVHKSASPSVPSCGMINCIYVYVNTQVINVRP